MFAYLNSAHVTDPAPNELTLYVLPAGITPENVAWLKYCVEPEPIVHVTLSIVIVGVDPPELQLNAIIIGLPVELV